MSASAERCRVQRHGWSGKFPRSSQRRQRLIVPSIEPNRVGGVGRPAELLAPGQAREGALAGLERAHAAGDPAVELQRDVAEQSQRLAAAARVRGEPVLVDQPPARLLGRVVEGGLADRLDLDRPVDALDRADEHVLGVLGAELASAHALAVLVARGASTSASWTTIQPVSVIQLVSSTFVPGT